MKRVSFDSVAFADFNEWAAYDRKVHKKILQLINDILRDPFAGIGKPELLKHQLKGYWSEELLTSIGSYIKSLTKKLSLPPAKAIINKYLFI